MKIIRGIQSGKMRFRLELHTDDAFTHSFCSDNIDWTERLVDAIATEARAMVQAIVQNSLPGGTINAG